jgi:SagB-type dehydrogenase family enzyme
MMKPGAVAREFHDATTHTPYSVRTSGHTLAWDIKPFPFKVYPDAPAIELPRSFEPITVDTLRSLELSGLPGVPGAAAPLTLESLTALLYVSAGVTRKKTYPGGGEILFRAAASTGALFQTEVYVVAGAVAGLEVGLYHFCPGDFTLRRLRAGDVREPLARAAADDGVRTRAATIVLSAIYWRNTWKYQARAYRHLFWDSGTMLANLLAAGHALGLAPRVVTGFVDADVNHLLGVDADREAALELVPVGPETDPAPAVEALAGIAPDVLPLSSGEVDYPELRAMQEASSLRSPEAVRAWRARTPPPRRPPPPETTPLPAPRTDTGRGLGDTIQHRGSSRRFTHRPLSALEFATALRAASRGVNGDVRSGLVDTYVIVSAVEGVMPGAYCYWPDRHALERLAAGDFRRESARLCLEQALGGDAAAVIYFLAPLDAVLAAFGDRGYRLVNLEAGIAGGRAYLAAYAQGFGASGLTFYDREVVSFFSPHAAGRDAIFVTALGRGARALT